MALKSKPVQGILPGFEETLSTVPMNAMAGPGSIKADGLVKAFAEANTHRQDMQDKLGDAWNVYYTMQANGLPRFTIELKGQ